MAQISEMKIKKFMKSKQIIKLGNTCAQQINKISMNNKKICFVPHTRDKILNPCYSQTCTHKTRKRS